MKLPSIKAQLIFFLSILALYLSIAQNSPAFLLSALIAVVSAVSLESIITYAKTKRFNVTESSVISGLIVGYVISGREPGWKLILAAVLAIASKHIIRFKNRHLFNPAAFGIFLSVILFGAATQWRGAGLWYVFVPAGAYFVWKIRKLEIAFVFLAVSWVLFGIEAFIRNSPLLSALIYQNYFFIFVMLVEPKTTPIRIKGKILFGLAAGILVFIQTLIGVSYDAELASLLAINLAVPALNKLR